MGVNETLDVVEYYNNKIKSNFNEVISKYFSEKVKSCNFDLKKIATSIDTIEKEKALISTHNAKFLSKFLAKKRLYWFLVFLSVVLVAIGAYLIYDYTQKETVNLIAAGVVLLIVGLIFFILLMIILNKGKNAQKLIDPIIASNNNNIAEMEEYLSILVKKFSLRDFYDIFQKSFSQLKIDNYLNSKTYEQWKEVFEINKNLYKVNDDETSLSSEIHGTVYNHPFMYSTIKNIEWTTKIYYGSVVIDVEEKYYDNQKKEWRTKIVKKTVTASVEKPFPVFMYYTKSAYITNIYPELTFNTVNNPKLSAKKFYKEKNKENTNKERPMENPNFDELFLCERNNEQEFRVLFSLFTQEEMVKVINTYNLKDIAMFKRNNITFCYANNPLNFGVIDAQLFFDKMLSYSLENIEKKLYKSLNFVIENFYKVFAPFFSIVTYQQEKYVDKTELFESDLALLYCAESFANINLNLRLYFHKNTSNIVNDAICCFKNCKRNNNYFFADLCMFSFSHRTLTEWVNVFAYGRIVSVPVEYNHYEKICNKLLTLHWDDNNLYDDHSWNQFSEEFIKENKIIEITKRLGHNMVIFDKSISSVSNSQEIIDFINKNYNLLS